MKRRSRRPTIKTTAAQPRLRSGFIVGHMAVFVTVLLLLATPHTIEGFAFARKTHKVHSVSIVITRKFHKTVLLKLSASTSIEIPATINSQQSLNRIQSKIVKALMVTYIASMCVALPA
jgi:hypothetical protein